MSGMARTYFTVIAAAAAAIAARRQGSANRWIDRAERWRAKAGVTA